MRYFAFAFAWAGVFWAMPLATTRGRLTQPALSGLRVSLLVVGAYTPFVAAFALSFRDGTAWTLLKRVVPTLRRPTMRNSIARSRGVDFPSRSASRRSYESTRA
jgi:hypothetical protein